MITGMKWALAAVIVGGALDASAVETEAYIELTQDEVLRELNVSDGKNQQVSELKEALTVIEGSVLALDVMKLNQAIELDQRNPHEVRYPLRNKDGRLELSSSGWVCGVQIVDIPDEEIRSSAAANASRNLCISLETIKAKATVMEGNKPEFKSALVDVQKSNNNLALKEISSDVKEELAVAASDQLAEGASYAFGGGGFTKPLDGSLKVLSGFGPRNRRLHKGVDLDADTGTTVRSAMAGRILDVKAERRSRRKGRGGLGGYGLYLIVVHPEKNMRTVYAHLSAFKASEGQSVSAGERIALSGNTGRSSTPHLHFETHIGERATNPSKFLSGLTAKLEMFFEKFFKLS